MECKPAHNLTLFVPLDEVLTNSILPPGLITLAPQRVSTYLKSPVPVMATLCVWGDHNGVFKIH
jgi:hypothetical protein